MQATWITPYESSFTGQPIEPTHGDWRYLRNSIPPGRDALYLAGHSQDPHGQKTPISFIDRIDRATGQVTAGLQLPQGQHITDRGLALVGNHLIITCTNGTVLSIR